MDFQGLEYGRTELHLGLEITIPPRIRCFTVKVSMICKQESELNNTPLAFQDQSMATEQPALIRRQMVFETRHMSGFPGI